MARFKQQQLPAWQPILTPGPVIVTFFIVALIFLPIGIVLLVTSGKVRSILHARQGCPGLTPGCR